MDPPHGLPRKRKQVPDEVQDVEQVVVDDCQVLNIPRYSSKRPRLNRPDPPSRCMKKGHLLARPPPIDRLGNDIEDHGIVNKAAPGPLTGSLLHLRKPPIVTIDSYAALDLPIPFDVAMARVPSTSPYVSRNTLKELDLDIILRSPQLRHDLMFDNGLQFRPTCSRRKRQLCEAYWAALIREVESGCTCFSVGKRGTPLTSPACVCNEIPAPPLQPIIGYSPSLQVMTVRMPSRIRPLLSEFLEVLLLVIQPLQSVSGMYVNPDSFKAQMDEHSTQANYIRSIIDPVLIEQEIKHDNFDLSSLLCAIGSLLKGHCAPMRDNAIEGMVRAAETCKPGGGGTKAEGVRAIRTCLEILELMKLDIANHQLQSLRLSISRSSAVYELQNFRAKFASCNVTQQWLQSSADFLNARTSPIPHPLYAPNSLDFQKLGRNRQIYMSVIKGVTDLVFHSPETNNLETPSGEETDYPETLHLDKIRLRSLSKELADIVLSYMFLLLFRQLIHSSAWEDIAYRQPLPKAEDAALLKLKNELLILNSSRMGHSLLYGCRPTPEGSKCADFKENVALHIAKRAQEYKEPMLGTSPSNASSFPSSTTSSPATTPPTSPISPEGTPFSFTFSSSPTLPPPSLHTFGSPPDTRIVNLARRWILENVHIASPVCSVIYNRLHEVVFSGVVAQVYPGRQCTTGQLFTSAIESYGPLRQDGKTYTMPLSSGMEPLADEIRALTDKMSRVVMMHLNVYLPVYELDGFVKI
ncbi:T-complex protein 11-domain-containing protein [Lentinula raphanica]|uniref:T-complex protein 11-domain-containing protein n=1 Tax=Lentinula raphanica TaxID=153919 RepID=A0AA38UBH0_9AGAR|nr:T-complex protein 11-domain-containing protein [Lentinula raphanica]KAJ3836101.1 T-complex protein 11-domain-containing protein [Lentinula raphanica]KAJ3977808.1 T-complex protein 11-domain-containing protein [Lentinula raphanica]